MTMTVEDAIAWALSAPKCRNNCEYRCDCPLAGAEARLLAEEVVRLRGLVKPPEEFFRAKLGDNYG